MVPKLGQKKSLATTPTQEKRKSIQRMMLVSAAARSSTSRPGSGSGDDGDGGVGVFSLSACTRPCPSSSSRTLGELAEIDTGGAGVVLGLLTSRGAASAGASSPMQ